MQQESAERTSEEMRSWVREKTSVPYRGEAGSYASWNLTGQRVSASVLTPVNGITNILSLGGISHPKLFQLKTTEEKHQSVSADIFCEAIIAAKKSNKFGAAVYVYDQS